MAAEIELKVRQASGLPGDRRSGGRDGRLRQRKKKALSNAAGKTPKGQKSEKHAEA